MGIAHLSRRHCPTVAIAAILAAMIAAAGTIDAEPADTINVSNSWLLPQNDFPVFYRHFKDRVTWFEADAVCQFHHAQLVTVESANQFEVMRGYLKELDVTENVWIGLKRNSEASEFTWTNYQPLAKSGYFREEVPRSSEPVCVVSDPTANFKWHSLHCGGPEVASFVCELPVPSWASKNDGCMASVTDGSTVTFLPEHPAIQFAKECSPGVSKNVTCKGNMKQSEVMERLSCPDTNKLLKTLFKSVKPSLADVKIKTTTPNPESDVEDYVEMVTIAQYNDETFQSISKVMMGGRGDGISFPQEMSAAQEPIKSRGRGDSGFDTNGIDSAFIAAGPVMVETTTAPATTTAATTIAATTIAATTTIAPPTIAATTTIAAPTTTEATTIAAITRIAPPTTTKATTIAAITTIAPPTTTKATTIAAPATTKATTIAAPATTASPTTTEVANATAATTAVKTAATTAAKTSATTAAKTSATTAASSAERRETPSSAGRRETPSSATVGPTTGRPPAARSVKTDGPTGAKNTPTPAATSDSGGPSSTAPATAWSTDTAAAIGRPVQAAVTTASTARDPVRVYKKIDLPPLYDDFPYKPTAAVVATTASSTAAADTATNTTDEPGDKAAWTTKPSAVDATTAAADATTAAASNRRKSAGRDSYVDHPSRSSRHLVRPKQLQHHHSYPYILYRLLG